MNIQLDSIIEIHPDKDELIVINRYKTTAVSKGTWRSSKRGSQFTITVYEIDSVISYTIHLKACIRPDPKPLYGRNALYYKMIEFPITTAELYEHFLLP